MMWWEGEGRWGWGLERTYNFLECEMSRAGSKRLFKVNCLTTLIMEILRSLELESFVD